MKSLFAFQKYGFLMEQLISRDFKVKYKRSVLGILWSLLYPVLTMGVMALVFTNIFKMAMPGVSYLAYLMTGLVIFNYFSEATNLAMSSVVANFSLINKVYLPKYIFPLQKCIFVLINFALSLIPLYAIILLTGTGLSFTHLLLPFIYLTLFLFTAGFAFMLSTVSVFLRDMFYIYGVILTLWQYLTPIMYDISYIPERFVFILKLNPLYWYVSASRDIILFHRIPSLTSWIAMLGFALFFLSAGVFFFRRYQNRFIYYV